METEDDWLYKKKKQKWNAQEYLRERKKAKKKKNKTEPQNLWPEDESYKGSNMSSIEWIRLYKPAQGEGRPMNFLIF